MSKSGTYLISATVKRRRYKKWWWPVSEYYYTTKDLMLKMTSEQAEFVENNPDLVMTLFCGYEEYVAATFNKLED